MQTLNIVFEDGNLIVLDKPTGLVVNNSQTSNSDTLQNQLSRYFGLGDHNLGIGGRAGIVHRLDRETSGLMVIAKTDKAFEALQEQFKNRKVQKEYTTLVHGAISDSVGEILTPIGRIGAFGRFGIVADGREAQTLFEVSGRYRLKDEIFEQTVADFTKNKIRYLEKLGKHFSLLTVYPKTGRTHQIRVHLKSISHPVVADKIYGPGRLLNFDLAWCSRLFLHAKAISFSHPVTQDPMFFESELPVDLSDALNKLVQI